MNLDNYAEKQKAADVREKKLDDIIDGIREVLTGERGFLVETLSTGTKLVRLERTGA